MENGITVVVEGAKTSEAQCKVIEEQKLKDLEVKKLPFSSN